MEYEILIWPLVSILVAVCGIGRKIGFWKALVISLIFSPLAGAIAIGQSDFVIKNEKASNIESVINDSII